MCRVGVDQLCMWRCRRIVAVLAQAREKESRPFVVRPSIVPLSFSLLVDQLVVGCSLISDYGS